MRLSSASVLVLASMLGALLASGPAFAQPAGSGGNPLVCNPLRQNVSEMGRRMEPRQLNNFLFEAAEKGCLPLLGELLDRGASLEARDRSGSTVLLKAAAAGQEEVVTLLLDRGAPLEQHNLKGSTALTLAVNGNHRKLVEALLERGASIEPVNRASTTLLGAAAFNGSARIVRLLLEKGADPSAPDAAGKGPILYAAAKGFTPVVEALIEAGTDVNQAYGHDLTALMWAAGHANDVPEPEGLATVKLLVEKGARLDALDDRGRSALMIAAERGHGLVVAYLLERGADPALRDREGKAAVDLASNQAVRDVLASVR